MAEGERRKRPIMEQLAHLRDDFSDEVLPNQIDSGSSDNRFKVRRGWFASVTAALAEALEQGLVTGTQISSKVNDFIDWAEVGDFGSRGGGAPTTAEDIQKANKILDLVLGRKEGGQTT